MLIKAKGLLFFLLAALVITSAAYAGMSEEQFRHWYTNYYHDPSSAKLLPALKFYIQTAESESALESPDEDRESRRLGYARFFAILSESRPKLQQYCETLFASGIWIQKEAILDIFERSGDEKIKTRLRQWALTEEDDDCRIRIEQAALAKKPVELLFEQPIRTEAQLEESWACFFSLGNTRVVEASIDLLGNTMLGYCPAEKKEDDFPYELSPRERRLREYTKTCLLQQAAGHARIRSAILQYPDLTGSEEGKAILKTLAYQALELKDAALCKAVFSRLTHWKKHSAEYLHYAGSLAALERRPQDVKRAVRELDRRDCILAEWLRGYQAYLNQLPAGKTWTRKPASGSGNTLALLCGQVLANTKNLGMYEVWKLREIPERENSYINFCEYVMNFQVPDMRFSLCIQSQPTSAWVIRGEETFNWVKATSAWVEVENTIVSEPIKELTSIAEISKLLVAHKPAEFYTLIGQEKTYGVLVFKKVKPLAGTAAALDQHFPGQTHKVRKVRFWVDPEKGAISCMLLDIIVYRDGKKIAQGTLERVFYDYDETDLDWTRKLR